MLIKRMSDFYPNGSNAASSSSDAAQELPADGNTLSGAYSSDPDGSNLLRQSSTAPIQDEERGQTMLRGCYKSWQEGLYTDVQIRVGSQTFPTHRLVLASLSDYFKPLFELDSNAGGEIALHNMEADDFSVLLHYAYTGHINIGRHNVQNVAIAADYLSINKVKNECEKFLASNLDADNVCDALGFASNYSLSILRGKALQFLKENLSDVSRTSAFRSLDPEFMVTFFSDDSLVLRVDHQCLKFIEREELILTSVLRYLSDRQELDSDTLEKVFRTVRLATLPEDAIEKCLGNFEKLKENEVVKKYVQLREVAVQHLQRWGYNSSGISGEGAEASGEIPDAWLRRRKFGAYKLQMGRAYAAGGQVDVPRDNASHLQDDPEREIERIEFWLRRWDGRIVIGGLAVTYRSGQNYQRNEDGEISAPLQYRKGGCDGPEEDHFEIVLAPGEYIIKVMLSSGFLIDQMTFVTSTGRSVGPIGGPGGGEHSETAPESGVSYLYDINCEETITQEEPAVYNLALRWIISE